MCSSRGSELALTDLTYSLEGDIAIKQVNHKKYND
jgi:hypothetical protein